MRALPSAWRHLAKCAVLIAFAACRFAVAGEFGDALHATNAQPKLIVLLHGATAPPTADADIGIPQPSTGTLGHTRFYFGYDFVRNLMNVPDAIGLKTLSGVMLSRTSWEQHNGANSHGKVTMVAGADDNSDDDHIVVPGNFTGDGTPPIAVFLAHRDGSRKLIDQTESTINQIYKIYKAEFGTTAHPHEGRVQPNIIFLTHSMGGLVVRTLLTNPTDPIDAETLSASVREKADAIRDKTLYAITLAGPHEGSPLANRSTDLFNQVANLPTVLFAPINAFDHDFASGVLSFMKGMLNAPNMAHLRTDFWSQLNAGVLSPERMARTDGTLIPIYTLIGHSPAGKFYTDPKNDSQFPMGGITSSDLTNEDRRREAIRSFGMMALEYLLYNFRQTGEPTRWKGTSNDPELDDSARYHRELIGDPKRNDNPGLPFGFPTYYNRSNRQVGDFHLTQHDSEIDGDGLVPASSGMGYKLGHDTAWYFDHTKVWNTASGATTGSWFRLSAFGSPWEFTNHETIHRTAAVGHWLFENIIDQAGPLTSPEEVSVWANPRFLNLVRPGQILEPAILEKLRTIEGPRPRLKKSGGG